MLSRALIIPGSVYGLTTGRCPRCGDEVHASQIAVAARGGHRSGSATDAPKARLTLIFWRREPVLGNTASGTGDDASCARPGGSTTATRPAEAIPAGQSFA